MAKVVAHSDIIETVSRNRVFTVAKKGDVGVAIPNVKPHEDENWGKIFVRFESKGHGYWCDPGALTFKTLDRGCHMQDYIAVKETFTPHSNFPVTKSKTSFEYHFGNNLRLCRKARGMTQADMGSMMGKAGMPLAQSTICYRENSPYSPSGRFVKAAARALQVPPFVLFMPLTDCNFFTDAKQFILNVSSAMCPEEP